MPDNFFIDSNVALYVLDANAARKKQIALSLVEEVPFVSPQVIFECLNVCIKKLKYSKAAASEFVNFLADGSYLQPETEEIVSLALMLFSKYSLQVFDSKIIATTLDAGCSVLYSEDMQNGLIIENSLTIMNPFL